MFGVFEDEKILYIEKNCFYKGDFDEDLMIIFIFSCVGFW